MIAYEHAVSFAVRPSIYTDTVSCEPRQISVILPSVALAIWIMFFFFNTVIKSEMVQLWKLRVDREKGSQFILTQQRRKCFGRLKPVASFLQQVLHSNGLIVFLPQPNQF